MKTQLVIDIIAKMKNYFVILLVCSSIPGILGQRRQPQCEQGSCYPATGDLLIGREKMLSATSTCGMQRPERYCVVSYLEKPTKCAYCNSSEPWVEGINEESHRIENIVSSFRGRRRRYRWWQAVNGEEKVSIQLKLEAEFHFTHLIMTFKTFRPKAMLIERSFDFGKTWAVYRYFAENCARSFPGVSRGPVRSLSDVICEQRYSGETPSSGGEVIFKVLPPFIRIADPYSEAVQDLLKLTDLRVNFTELHTLGDTLLDSRREIKEKYYYSVYDMTVRGSCSCYGHASRCLPVPGFESRPDMVHGQCECTHNTKGLNCEMCEDFYNDLPWRPARQNQPNACKKCNCNNHATKCHFDAARFKSTGFVSGGVCDNCMHNTIGVNCQECKPLFFQDPQRDIRDPEICQPCDCDTFGSKNQGICESITDELLGTVAGRCICKQYVTGDRCDTCVANYWNLREENPDGCEQCTCNPLGTIGDLGCDQDTGICRCKRYVTGRNCDECYPGFYGLSEYQYGCYACDCDIGGALRSTCDQASGQCYCRDNIVGKQCKQVESGYCYAHLDHHIFEAEYGKGSGNAKVYVREPIQGSVSYWTGPGYMKVMEGDSLEIAITDVPFSTFYDFVIRYDPRMPEVFQDVRVTLVRPERVDPEGLCGEFNPQDDFKNVALQPGARYMVVDTPSCLEEGKTYTLRLDFSQYRSGLQTPEATLLIDSVLIVPNVNFIPIYQGPGLPEYMLNEFLRFRCQQLQYSSIKQELPEECRRHTFSISAVLNNGALACGCNPMGSLSLECDPSGCQCPCKNNVVGRHCDKCAPGTYGFGPDGCEPCNCHEIGARDNFCNEQSGQCTCIQNVGGRTCDQCREGFWGFPQCRPCQCNGNADTCDPLTGACRNCRDNTAGDFCERCEDGYYGDPRVGVRIPCRPCMCPGGPGSTNQHADTCTFDPRSQEVYCNCYPGYQPPNCDRCIDNYYGNPLAEGGTCEPCVCNNNIDPNMPGSCNSDTGECLKCLYNTEGFNCEHCVAGFYGDATRQSCRQCICNPIGTNRSGGDCDRVSGQCPCLPNVVGQDCGQCAPAHWDLASGNGCQACNCDPTGSLSLDCNQLDGQCPCLDGRGGRKCADCEDFFFGDPNVQCFPCDCDPQGSESMQCDKRTGQCQCVAGVTGYKCDRCARGTTGQLPNCVPCGECFDNWDRVIRDLRDQTHYLVESAKNISVTGAIQAFDEEFKMMQNHIDEIRKILASVNFTQVDIQEIENMLEVIKRNLTDNSKNLGSLDEELKQTTARVQRGNTEITSLREGVEKLRKLAKALQDNATDIQARDVEGAFNITKEAEKRSREAQQVVDGTARRLAESEQIRQRTEDLINQRQADFDDQLERNRQNLDSLDSDVSDLSARLSDINNMVCGAPGAPCDALCGGGGCGRCGGESCDGAVTKADTALKMAQEAEDILTAKEGDANNLLADVQSAKQGAEEARDDAQMAYNAAFEAKNASENARTQLEDLLNEISQVLGAQRASPEDVERVTEEVLNMRVSLDPDEIRRLADKINSTVQGLQNIDQILADTENSRAEAQRLNRSAEQASIEAREILATAQEVRKALEGARKAQEMAENAINQAETDIADAESDLSMIDSETSTARDLSDESLRLLQELKERLEKLRTRYFKNDLDIQTAEETINKAEIAAEAAERKATILENDYADTSANLNKKYDTTADARERASKLAAKADKILQDTLRQKNSLENIQQDIGDNEKALVELSEDIDELNRRMDAYLKDIKAKHDFYRTC